MHTPMKNSRRKAGYTLTEVMTAVSILAMVMAAASLTYSMSIRIWRTASARMDASSAASLALTRCTMGTGGGFGLRAAFLPVQITSETGGWEIRFTTPAGMSGDSIATNILTFNADARTISYQSANAAPIVIGRNIVESTAVQQADAITITVRAEAQTGYKNTSSEMSTAIAPRNRS